MEDESTRYTVKVGCLVMNSRGKIGMVLKEYPNNRFYDIEWYEDDSHVSYTSFEWAQNCLYEYLKWKDKLK